MIDSSLLKTVRDATDIVSLISETVPLAKRWRFHLGRCPFCKEDADTLFVDYNRSFYNCINCGQSGDVYMWLVKTRGMSIQQAFETLFQKLKEDA